MTNFTPEQIAAIEALRDEIQKLPVPECMTCGAGLGDYIDFADITACFDRFLNPETSKFTVEIHPNDSAGFVSYEADKIDSELQNEIDIALDNKKGAIVRIISRPNPQDKTLEANCQKAIGSNTLGFYIDRSTADGVNFNWNLSLLPFVQKTGGAKSEQEAKDNFNAAFEEGFLSKFATHSLLPDPIGQRLEAAVREGLVKIVATDKAATEFKMLRDLVFIKDEFFIQHYDIEYPAGKEFETAFGHLLGEGKK